jgi:hypothetical protein
MNLAFYFTFFSVLVGASSFEENRHLRYEKVSRQMLDANAKQTTDQMAVTNRVATHRKELVHQNKKDIIRPGKHPSIHHSGSHNRRRMQEEETGCFNGEVWVEVELQTDFYANETSWELTRDQDNFVVMSGSGFSNTQAYWDGSCLPKNCYTFTIFDARSDG